MVGSAILRLFKKKNFTNLVTKTSKQLNLIDQKKTINFLKNLKPDCVIIAAAKVGGINANNKYRADFLYNNLQIQNNLIHGSYLAGVKRVIFLGSSCIYPKTCKQPIKEKYLLNSPLEYTNEPYAIAKISGIKMIENYNHQYKLNYLSLMPCNLYGPNDNYNLETSHFIPALIKKIHFAKIKNNRHIDLWGDGKPKREVMHVDDLALAVLFFLNKKISYSYVNIGSGKEFTIRQYAQIISNILGYKGKIKFDRSMLNGTPRKLLDCSISNSYSWYPRIDLEEGLKNTYQDFIQSI